VALLPRNGLPRGEALGLRWSDVDLDNRRVSITQQYTMVGAVPTMLPVKSDRSRRVVDLDPVTVDLLRRHRIGQAEHRLAIGEAYDPDGFGLVFAKPDGSPHHPKRVSARFGRRVARAEVPDLRLHDVRHTAASIMLAPGEQPRVVQERLGHSTVAFTLARYQKVLPGAQAEAAARDAQLLDG
jgi:integrase